MTRAFDCVLEKIKLYKVLLMCDGCRKCLSSAIAGSLQLILVADLIEFISDDVIKIRYGVREHYKMGLC